MPAAFVAVTTAILLAFFPVGFLNYDTAYALLWGRELAHFDSPSQAAPLAPTPHPLTEIAGALLSPLGADGAAAALVLIAYISLGLIAFFVYRLGQLWFDRWVGLAAAVLVMTRAPFLSNGLRAYIDLPYIAFCLAALLIVTRRPRAGWPVLALLALAGLLRPEAWLFSFAYMGYLLVDVERRGDSPAHSLGGWSVRRRRGIEGLPLLVGLTLAGPVGWALFDLITTGNPTYSFTETQDTVEALERQTGPVDLVLYGPRRLGEVLQWPGMIGAFAGLCLGLGLMRRKVEVGAIGAALALVAFAILACSGLAILPRYTMLAASILAIFAAAALLGWRLVDGSNPWRRRWQVIAGFVALMFVVWLPNQYDLVKRVDTDLSNQSTIESDLHDLVDSGVFAKPLCGPVAGPNHRAVPRLAYWLDISPYDVINTTDQAPPEYGYFVQPRNQFVIDNFVFDPTDTEKLDIRPPTGFSVVDVDNPSWRVYRRCPPG